MDIHETLHRSTSTDVDHRGSFRWVICFLLFFATAINYIDRQVFALLGPGLTEEFHWSESDYSLIVSAFTLAYALGYSLAGRMMDWLDVRKGFMLVVAAWSAAAMLHGLVRPLVDSALPLWNAMLAGTALGGLTPRIVSLAGFCTARFALGISEGGNFPGAIKTVSQWYPKRERALATGLFNAGCDTGSIVAACLVPWIVKDMNWGWPGAFYVTGALGFAWLAFWFLIYDAPQRHPRVSAAELAYIRSDPPDPSGRVAWRTLLGYRQTWTYALGMFLTSPIWWFLLFWLPKFLKNNHGVDLQHVFWPLLLVYLMADAGGIAGGALSSWLMHRGRTVNFARKTALLTCALCATPVAAAPHVSSMWLAVVLVGLAAAAQQGFSANLMTIVSDTVPRKAVASVIGIGGTTACCGMLLFSTLVGRLLDWSERLYGQKDYSIPFLIAAFAYLTATGVVHLLLPRLEPIK
jgi:ACS family hexuronate transporter-like MFS transporter